MIYTGIGNGSLSSARAFGLSHNPHLRHGQSGEEARGPKFRADASSKSDLPPGRPQPVDPKEAAASPPPVTPVDIRSTGPAVNGSLVASASLGAIIEAVSQHRSERSSEDLLPGAAGATHHKDDIPGRALGHDREGVSARPTRPDVAAEPESFRKAEGHGRLETERGYERFEWPELSNRDVEGLDVARMLSDLADANARGPQSRQDGVDHKSGNARDTHEGSGSAGAGKNPEAHIEALEQGLRERSGRVFEGRGIDDA